MGAYPPWECVLTQNTIVYLSSNFSDKFLCIYYVHLFFLYIAEDNFHTVYSELVTVKANYYQLGIGLGGELLAIRKGTQDIGLAFSDVLLVLLRKGYKVDRFGLPTGRNW